MNRKSSAQVVCRYIRQQLMFQLLREPRLHHAIDALLRLSTGSCGWEPAVELPGPPPTPDPPGCRPPAGEGPRPLQRPRWSTTLSPSIVAHAWPKSISTRRPSASRNPRLPSSLNAQLPQQAGGQGGERCAGIHRRLYVLGLLAVHAGDAQRPLESPHRGSLLRFEVSTTPFYPILRASYRGPDP